MPRRKKEETQLSKEVWRYLSELKNASNCVKNKDVWIPILSDAKLLNNNTDYCRSRIALHRLLQSSIGGEDAGALIDAVWHMKGAKTKAPDYIRERLTLNAEQVEVIKVQAKGSAGGKVICINFSRQPSKNSPIQDARAFIDNETDSANPAQVVTFISSANFRFLNHGRDVPPGISVGSEENRPSTLTISDELNTADPDAPIVTPPADDSGFDFSTGTVDNSDGQLGSVLQESSSSPMESSAASATPSMSLLDSPVSEAPQSLADESFGSSRVNPMLAMEYLSGPSMPNEDGSENSLAANQVLVQGNVSTPPQASTQHPTTPSKIISKGRALIGSFGKAIKALRPSPSRTSPSTVDMLSSALKAVKERRSQGEEVDATEEKLLNELILHCHPGTDHENPDIVTIGRRNYVRLPPQSEPGPEKKSRPVRHHAKVAALVASRCDDTSASKVLTQAFDLCEEGGGKKKMVCLTVPTKEERIHRTLEFRRVAKTLSWNSTQAGCQFVQNVCLEKMFRTFADDKVMRHHLNQQAPRELYYHGADEFEYGEGNKKGKGRKALKTCQFFIICHPDELLAQHIQQIRQTKQFLYASTFCSGNNQIIVLVFNIDKAVSETTYMCRVLNQPDCNQARKNILLGQVRNNADESRFNVHRYLRELPGGLESHIRSTLERNLLEQPPSDTDVVRCICGIVHGETETTVRRMTCTTCYREYLNSERCLGPSLSYTQEWHCCACGGPPPVSLDGAVEESASERLDISDLADQEEGDAGEDSGASDFNDEHHAAGEVPGSSGSEVSSNSNSDGNDQDDSTGDSGPVAQRGLVHSITSGEVANPLYELAQNSLDDGLLVICIQFLSQDGSTRKEAVVVVTSPCPCSQDIPLKDRKEEIFANTLAVKEVQDVKFLDSCAVRVYEEASDWSNLRLLRLREENPLQEEGSSTSYVAVASVDSHDCVTAWTPIRVDAVPVDADRYSVEKIETFRVFGMSGSDFKMESLLANHHLQGKYFCVGCLHCSTSPQCLECGITVAYRWGPYGNGPLMEKREAYTGTNNTERNAISKNIDGPGELELHDHKRTGDSLHIVVGNTEHSQKLLVLDLVCFMRQSPFTERLRERLEALKKLKSDLATMIKDSKEGLLYYRRRLEAAKAGEVYNGLTEDVLRQKVQHHRDALTYAENYDDAVESALDDARICMENDDHCILVMILMEAYWEVCGITLGKHFGGMTHTGGTAVALLANWDKVVRYFFAAVKIRLQDLVDMKALAEIFRKSTVIFHHLRKVEVIQRKQEKLSDSDLQGLRCAYDDLKDAFKEEYPEASVWNKLHYAIGHMTKKAECNGMIARANAQGFEAWHAWCNAQLAQLWSCKDPKVKADQLIKNLTAWNLPSTVELHEIFLSTKRKMPPRATRRNARKISDESAETETLSLIQELGLYNQNSDPSALPTSTAGATAVPTDEDNDDDTEAEEEIFCKETSSFLFCQYVERPAYFEKEKYGPERPLCICPKCGRYVPEVALVVHDIRAHGTSKDIQKVMRSVDLRYVPDPFRRVADGITRSIAEDCPKTDIIKQVCRQVMEARPDWPKSRALARGKAMVESYFKALESHARRGANSNSAGAAEDALGGTNNADDESDEGEDEYRDDDYEEEDEEDEDEVRVTLASIPNLSYREVQHACKERGLPAAGKGEVLRKRLAEHLQGLRGSGQHQATRDVIAVPTSSAGPSELSSGADDSSMEQRRDDDYGIIAQSTTTRSGRQTRPRRRPS